MEKPRRKDFVRERCGDIIIVLYKPARMRFHFQKEEFGYADFILSDKERLQHGGNRSFSFKAVLRVAHDIANAS